MCILVKKLILLFRKNAFVFMIIKMIVFHNYYYDKSSMIIRYNNKNTQCMPLQLIPISNKLLNFIS